MSDVLRLFGDTAPASAKLAPKVFAPEVVEAIPALPVESLPAKPEYKKNSGLTFIGKVTVDGKERWILSDGSTGLSFGLGSGETYAGWTLEENGPDGLVISREGVHYLVLVH